MKMKNPEKKSPEKVYKKIKTRLTPEPICGRMVLHTAIVWVFMPNFHRSYITTAPRRLSRRKNYILTTDSGVSNRSNTSFRRKPKERRDDPYGRNGQAAAIWQDHA